MSVIEIKNVTKTFGEKVAIEGINLTIPEGRIFGLLGPNGAGKTTLIRIINRITIPTEGTVLFDGHPITDADVAKIGYLPEERGLYRKMKVGDQAMYLARLRGMSQAEATAALKKWFIRFGIQDWWDKKVEELSKGMAQKLQFITIKEEGATIILSTHNMESVEELCDEIALINKSHLVVTGGVDEIRRRYGSSNIEVIYTGEAISPVEGVFSVLSDEEVSGRHTPVLSLADGITSNAALQAVIAGGVALNSFKELIPRMNDIFIKLVTEEA